MVIVDLDLLEERMVNRDTHFRSVRRWIGYHFLQNKGSSNLREILKQLLQSMLKVHVDSVREEHVHPFYRENHKKNLFISQK